MAKQVVRKNGVASPLFQSLQFAKKYGAALPLFIAMRSANNSAVSFGPFSGLDMTKSNNTNTLLIK